MKKVLINITNGFSLRYICHTEILKTLLKEKLEITILSADAVSTKKNIGIDGINYLKFSDEELNIFKFSSRFYNFLEELRMFTHGGNYKTPKIVFDYTYKKKNFKNLSFKLIKLLLNKSFILRKFLLYIQSFYYPKKLLELIKNNNPDFILTTSLGTFSFDEYVLRIANKLNINCATAILSWDNTTTRGYPGAMPKKIFSWTDKMKQELLEFSDCKKKSVIISGIPHFDNYFFKEKLTKKIFLENFNIDKKKKIILFITKSPSTYQYNPNICKIIVENILKQELKNCHLITRIHPLFYKINKKNNQIEFREALEVFKNLEKKYDCLSINFPNITSYKQNFEMHRNEQDFLKNLLFYSDVIVNIYSTINIEGAIFNKPLVNIDFDNLKPMYQWNKKYQRQSIEIDRNLDHNHRVIKTSGVKNVQNESELINAISEYLKNPKIDSQNRSLIVKNEVGPNKGNAGNFIANKIINSL
jgi:hypothetical protein